MLKPEQRVGCCLFITEMSTTAKCPVLPVKNEIGQLLIKNPQWRNPTDFTALVSQIFNHNDVGEVVESRNGDGG